MPVCPELYSYPYGRRMYWRMSMSEVRNAMIKANPWNVLGEVEENWAGAFGLAMPVMSQVLWRGSVSVFEMAVCLAYRARDLAGNDIEDICDESGRFTWYITKTFLINGKSGLSNRCESVVLGSYSSAFLPLMVQKWLVLAVVNIFFFFDACEAVAASMSVPMVLKQ